jgi:hypothetical protein
MINKYINKIQIKIRHLVGANWTVKLDDVEKKIISAEKKVHHKRLRVLIGPSFVMFEPSFALDKSLSFAFRLRGVDVIPIYCDSFQHVECNFIGGAWGNFSKGCKDCKTRSENLWQANPNKPLKLSKYVAHSEIEQISTLVSTLTFQGALSYKKDGIAYGMLAKDILVNNYLVGSPTLIENHEYLLKVHLQNLLMVSLAYQRILDEQKPDRVVSNDSYYGMWAILQHQCGIRSIPFYSHYPLTKNRVAFAHNDAAMNLNFRKSWKEFSKIALTSDDEVRLDKWLGGERGLRLDTANLSGHETSSPILEYIDILKPTIVLPSNVIWDLAALNKQIIFKDMIEWILETIKWFQKNPDFQLIIKPHPAETSPQLPRTRETVASAIEFYEVQLPRNVFILKSDAKVTLKDLFLDFNIRGIAVHTSTVGFEYPAQGVPVVTTAKSPYRGFGFTIDPNTKQDYFMQIDDLLRGNRKKVSEESQILARKFIKFYQFHYYSDLGLFVGNPPELAENYLELLKSEDGPFGYVVNSIIDGQPINAENRWLPES